MEQTIYIKMRNRLKVSPTYEVKLGDVAQLAGDAVVVESLQDEVIYKITARDKTHVVIDVMKIIEIIKQKPLIYKLIYLVLDKLLLKLYMKKESTSDFFGLVWLLLFIGAALAIIYFHEDVSMQQVHQRLYYMITGEFKAQPLLFQIPYSLGLGLGMVLFFNHVFQKRINEEPSPLEVEMFQYQQSLDQYVIVHENKDNMKQLTDD